MWNRVSFCSVPCSFSVCAQKSLELCSQFFAPPDDADDALRSPLHVPRTIHARAAISYSLALGFLRVGLCVAAAMHMARAELILCWCRVTGRSLAHSVSQVSFWFSSGAQSLLQTALMVVSGCLESGTWMQRLKICTGNRCCAKIEHFSTFYVQFFVIEVLKICLLIRTFHKYFFDGILAIIIL